MMILEIHWFGCGRDVRKGGLDDGFHPKGKGFIYIQTPLHDSSDDIIVDPGRTKRY